MINIIIVDDERKEYETLKQYLARFSEENEVQFNIKYYNEPISFLEEYTTADIIFMDVEMPLMDGMSAAEKLRKMDEKVTLIFITNMAQYAIKGYGVAALDYVLKPVKYTRFATILKKAIRIKKENSDPEVMVKTVNGMRKLYSSTIVYIEIRDHLLIYYTVDGKVEVWGTLKEAEKKLPSDFVRCNHSVMVNMKYILSLNGDSLDIEVEGKKKQLSISHSKKKELITKLNKYLGT